MSLKASSKFSTSLACMFLLQSEAALMAALHTWITGAHYSVFGGTQADFEQSTLNVLYLIKLGARRCEAFDLRRCSSCIIHSAPSEAPNPNATNMRTAC